MFGCWNRLFAKLDMIHNEFAQTLSMISHRTITLKQGQIIMTAALDRLTQEVAETKAAADSAVALIKGLAQQIRDNVGDDDALNALADSLDASQAEIAAAITENTPAPAPPPAA